jgi:hypothetical protein
MAEEVERRALGGEQRPGPTMDTSDSITPFEIVAVPLESFEFDRLVYGSESGSRGRHATQATGAASDDDPSSFELYGNHGLTGQITGLAQILLQGPPDEILE